jgi:hypothetical protein
MSRSVAGAPRQEAQELLGPVLDPRTASSVSLSFGDAIGAVTWVTCSSRWAGPTEVQRDLRRDGVRNTPPTGGDTMTALTMERHHTIAAEEPPTLSTRHEWRVNAARERLSSLLAQAAALDLDDAPGWARLRAAAHATTSLLCAAALLPPHLHVRHGDPPVVVARTIAAAWRSVELNI